ncbi:MAG: type I restriction-modification system subunit M N-terminal domain-containing protein, partial [Cyclobacteriaceae bacterium]|nr:type I restriction-modification system subunit M N-terminal domain-containing protein [Cyclobacteriaceae bacterium]
MTKNSPKADIDFERDLWKAADELRGAVAENQYKDYVLSLIFIKHLSERYEIRKDELQGLMKDPQSSYYSKDKDEMAYTIEDPDEYLSKNVLVMPKEASWQYLQDNAEQDDIKVKVDDALDLLQEVLDTYKPGNPDLLPRIFVKSQLT